MSKNKKNLGQFYTTNYKYILQNFQIPDGIENVIEPFVGNGDLINFLFVIIINRGHIDVQLLTIYM